MPKGYWIAHVDVRGAPGYNAYSAALPEVLKPHGGRFLVRGGTFEAIEGKGRARHVAIEFTDYATALACYRSKEYTAIAKLRHTHADIDFVVAEGYDGVQPPQPASPPAAAAKKGYWIGHIDVTEPEGYKAYMAADMAPFGQFGGRFLVRGGTSEITEGKTRSRHVLLEFPSHEAARACYRSAGYQAAKKLREGKAALDLVIIEGNEAPQG